MIIIIVCYRLKHIWCDWDCNQTLDHLQDWVCSNKLISTLLYYYWCSIVLDKTDVKGKLLMIFRA